MYAKFQWYQSTSLCACNGRLTWKSTFVVWLAMKENVSYVQYIPRNMDTVFVLLCFVVVIHWLIFPYPSGLLYWHCGNLTIAPVPAKQPWWIWINTSCEFIMNDCITTTKQSTTKPCAYFLGYTVRTWLNVDALFAVVVRLYNAMLFVGGTSHQVVYTLPRACLSAKGCLNHFNWVVLALGVVTMKLLMLAVV